MPPQLSKVRAEIEIEIINYNGVLAIKNALLAAQDVSDLKLKVEAKLIAAPTYVIETTCSDKKSGIKFLERATQACKKVVESYDGRITLKEFPRVTSFDKEKSICLSREDYMNHENILTRSEDDVLE